MSESRIKTREQVLEEYDRLVSEATCYRLAAAIIDLSDKFFAAANKCNDPSMIETGFSLAIQGRELVRDHVEFRDYLDKQLNSCYNGSKA